jgi:hypothetical protein
MKTQIMNNQLEYLQSIVATHKLDLDLFFNISINNRDMRLLGYSTKKNIKQCERAIGGKLIDYDEYNNGWLKGEIILKIPSRKQTHFYDTNILTFVLTPENK